MESTSEPSLFQSLNVELGAVLAARKAALEFERSLASLDQRDHLGRELFELRSAEAMLQGAQGPEGEALLAPLAQAAADDLEHVAAAVYKALDAHTAKDRDALVRTASAMLRVARMREALTRAFMTAARLGQRLEGFDDALAMTPETELLLLALRRIQALLERGGAWDPRDADQLYMRALSMPGRLRLQAASLRSGALALSGLPLPNGLQESLEPFRSLGLSAPLSLAWVEAGFSAEQCVDWREAGLRRPEHAHAWHCHGFDPVEAAAWAKADMMPDEAGAFIFCGVGGLSDAVALRKALGDVEHLLAWKRAGYDGRRVAELLKQGIRTPDQATAQGFSPEVEVLSQPAVDEAPAAPAPPEAAAIEAPAPEAVPAAAEAAPEAPAPSIDGTAWLGWGAVDADADPASAGGAAPCVSVVLGAKLFDLISASETRAPLGPAVQVASLQAEAEWDALLSTRQAVRKGKKQTGAWHIYAHAPQAAALFWGFSLPEGPAPWADAVDFTESETWVKRWVRKTEEWGEAGAKSPCQIGRSADGGWWIGLKQATFIAEPGGEAPLPVEPGWPTAAWREAFEDFCLKMEITRHAPHWVLVSVNSTAK